MRPGQNRLNKEQRQKAIESHLLYADSQGKEYSKHELLRLVRTAGYDISLATLYNDLGDLARNDSFIQDLASKTYSSIMHVIFNRYEKIYNLAMNVHDSDNHLSRKITRETGKGTAHEAITEESASIKLQALTVAKNALDSTRQMVNGENLHISASKWIEVSKQQEAEIFHLREKLNGYS